LIKYGIWRIRYTENVTGIYADWVRQDGAPVLFCSEYAAYVFKHSEEMKCSDNSTEYEVRKIEVQ
jgi:hypothetical protein